MIKVLLTGCGGRMGKVVASQCNENPDFEVVAGVDPTLPKCDFPVYSSCDCVKEEADVIIDFSFHAAITDVLTYAVNKNIPAVIATTGFSAEELAFIEKAEKSVPVFRSANMSLGINLICQLAKKAAKLLPDFDIEIIEKHHNQKVDSPSGTALMIADEIKSALPGDMEYVFGRQGICGKRTKNEIGIHAVRGGTIVGEHDVIFAGSNEVVTISHSAQSREILANGAICAAQFVIGKCAG
ncbi:MAG: 4-hydroxy-tetrahydrodipicolinate reductase, partial [Clostridia bacterium]|nr:4-hydroxy-tetrahydrodipicolinate reductase [Clostridia bacterium]